MKSRIYAVDEILIGDGSSYPDTVTAAALAAMLDHGTLSGLSDDDHTQYLLIDGSRAMTGNLLLPNNGYLQFGDSSYAIRGSTTSGWLRMYINNIAEAAFTTTAFEPVTSDGYQLGTTTKMWSDLFLAAGGVINWNSSAFTITENSGNLVLQASSGTISVAGALTVADDAPSATEPLLALNSTGGITKPAFIFFGNSSRYWDLGIPDGQSYFRLYDRSEGVERIVVTGGSSGTTTFKTGSGTTQLVIANTASAVNYWQFTGGTTGNSLRAYALGTDTDVGMQFDAKGAGDFRWYGNTSSYVHEVYNGKSTSGMYGMFIQFYGFTYSTGAEGVFTVFSDASATSALCYIDGDWYNKNGTYSTISDPRFKRNIVPASRQWDDVKQLAAGMINYELIDHPGKTLLGVRADEVAKVSPKLVSVREVDNEAVQLVNTSIMYMKGFQALGEALERIEQLESIVAQLQGA